MTAITRVSTGISDLDGLLQGGFPAGSITLVAGGPGTGKTVLGAQFIRSGALEHGERGVYASFGEGADTLKTYFSTLSWDFHKLEREGRVRILDFTTLRAKETVDSMLDLILEEVRTLDARRLVIDSITALTLALEERVEVRTLASILQRTLRRMNCTTILITETPWGSRSLGAGVEEFIADGIILLETAYEGHALRRRLAVLKMRGTEYEIRPYHYDIVSGKGIVVTPYPEVT